jgi:hypothetical protein
MLYREIMAVCSQIHTKHINTLCGQNVQSCEFKAGGTHGYHRFLEGLMSFPFTAFALRL